MNCCSHNNTPRRAFLADMGMGFTGLVLGTMLHGEGRVRGDSPSTPGGRLADGQPHFPPRAKNVIWLFMIGGTSHLESFDPKPALNRYAGQDDRRNPVRRCRDEPAEPECADRRAQRRQRSDAAGRLSAPGRVSTAWSESGSRSATGGRTWASASTTLPWSGRCGRPTTTTAPSFSFTPAGTCSRDSFRRSARGSITALAR